MNPSIQLTELEYRILQTFGEEDWSAGHEGLSWGMVYLNGHALFGQGWTGHPHLQDYQLRQVISPALGRLSRKGLLERSDSPFAVSQGHSWGMWSLTPLGRELMGIPLSE